MRALRDIPIRRKLRLIIMLTSGAALLMACAGFVTYEWMTFRGTMTRNLQTLGEVIGRNSAAALLFGDAKAAENNLSALQAVPAVIAGRIYTVSGQPFGVYTRTGSAASELPKPLLDGAVFTRGNLVLFVPIIHKGERIGTIGLQSDMQEMQHRLQRYAGIVALVLGAALCVALALSGRLGRLVSEPILNLVKTAHAVSDTRDYSVRATQFSQDELGQLTDSFNQMLAKVQARDDALQRSNRELAEFAYVASHDLQEPLRKIQAFGDRLKMKSAAALGLDGCDYLARMQNAAHRMQTLINDLLSYSRVTTKAQPFAPVDLGVVAREVLADLEISIEQTGGRVDIGPLPTIDADALQMRQLLQNIIGNALKYRRKDVPPVVQVSGHGNGDAAVQITVQDNGIGFDVKYADRIFGVFQRLHGRDEYEGTGVGLAICKKIAERHGGRITAHGQPGHGATFVVTLPLQQSNTAGGQS